MDGACRADQARGLRIITRYVVRAAGVARYVPLARDVLGRSDEEGTTEEAAALARPVTDAGCKNARTARYKKISHTRNASELELIILMFLILLFQLAVWFRESAFSNRSI
jgi:hypothetical protein